MLVWTQTYKNVFLFLIYDITFVFMKYKEKKYNYISRRITTLSPAEGPGHVSWVGVQPH